MVAAGGGSLALLLDTVQKGDLKELGKEKSAFCSEHILDIYSILVNIKLSCLFLFFYFYF